MSIFQICAECTDDADLDLSLFVDAPDAIVALNLWREWVSEEFEDSIPQLQSIFELPVPIDHNIGSPSARILPWHDRDGVINLLGADPSLLTHAVQMMADGRLMLA